MNGHPRSLNPYSTHSPSHRVRATTILGVKRGNEVALAGDGQVTIGDVVLKHGARKVRALYDGLVLAGFAGTVADALTLFDKFESQLKAWDGNLRRGAVELTKEWRTDRYLRRLEAQLIVADPESILVLSGEGDVIEPDDGIVAIGSGAPYATAAAKALMAHTDLGARAIVESAMTIAANLCIYTNDQFSIVTVRQSGAESAIDAQELPMDDSFVEREHVNTHDDEDDDEEDEETPTRGDRSAADEHVDDDDRNGSD